MVIKRNAQAKDKAAKGKVQKTITKSSGKAGIVKEDFEVDEDARYSGVVTRWMKSAGYGFVKLDDEDVVPGNEVMCYWKDIKSEDRWPTLYKDFKVELALKKAKKGNQWTIKGKDLTAPGGENIAIQAENEEKREYVGDRNMRFLGNVKFYDIEKGFGYIKLQEGYAIDAAVPNELKVQRDEIASGSDAPRLNNEMEVEFGIMLNKKQQYSCYNVTLPGGENLTRNIVDGREECGKTKFTGTITFWNWTKGYGWIKVDDASKLPAAAKTALKEDATKRSAKAKKNDKEHEEGCIYFRRGDRSNFDTKIGKGVKCTFKVYKDNQGVGACEVECK